MSSYFRDTTLDPAGVPILWQGTAQMRNPFLILRRLQDGIRFVASVSLKFGGNCATLCPSWPIIQIREIPFA